MAVLSGFLLISTEEGRLKRGTYDLWGYVKRRALRLVPAYYVAIAIVFFLWPLISPTYESSLGDVVWHASFLHTLNPATAFTMDPAFWSLTPEVVFYALLPVLVLKVRGWKGRAAMFALLWGLALASRAYQVSVLAPPIKEGEPLPFALHLSVLPTSVFFSSSRASW